MNTRYCTLYRIGYWGSLDVKCDTSPCTGDLSELVDHCVYFRLVNRFGESLDMGGAIFTEVPRESRVYDEDGVNFPDLDAAVRAHAQELVKVVAAPGEWCDSPPRHDTWQGDMVAAAFEVD